MLAIRLDAELERRLHDLATRTGRTKTFYVRQALESQLDDLEDFYLAETRMAKLKPGDILSLAHVKADLGLGGDDLDD